MRPMVEPRHVAGRAGWRLKLRRGRWHAGVARGQKQGGAGSTGGGPACSALGRLPAVPHQHMGAAGASGAPDEPAVHTSRAAPVFRAS
jgi:hypothetical protein